MGVLLFAAFSTLPGSFNYILFLEQVLFSLVTFKLIWYVQIMAVEHLSPIPNDVENVYI